MLVGTDIENDQTPNTDQVLAKLIELRTWMNHVLRTYEVPGRTALVTSEPVQKMTHKLPYNKQQT